ncbi:hypothetical protein [Mycobacterium talmoniae]|uniref:Uncharacterized protein n=1 Tax=Mycobacterium talmoniae TaxID=1858794 RepID=A0A1S1N2P3_9MYCO|nr:MULTISPECIES: hypothetical protein [Mycobacterium]OHU95457.1 hypothetical protein BKN37_23155 [Mycobacterium talmoniae]PQM48894.1 hypothetical protein C1Y40_00893 [Mycobacterium talmoniae]TDH49185.1 hypothetical protein E2F47_21310 [Mycobacterium eburneum]
MATVGEIALISFLVIAVGVIGVAFIRGVRANGFPDRPADGTEAYREALGGPRWRLSPPDQDDEQT